MIKKVKVFVRNDDFFLNYEQNVRESFGYLSQISKALKHVDKSTRRDSKIL